MTLLLLACAANPDSDDSTSVSAGDFAIEPTAMEAVFRVSWTTEDAATGRVEYGVDGAFDHSVPTVDSADGLSHTALLAGLGADETWAIRGVSETADGELDEGEGSVDIPAAPSRIVPDYVEDDTPERGGFNLITIATPNDSYVAILDRSGRPTWWYNTTVDGSILDAHYDPATSSIDMLVSDTYARFIRVGLDGTLLAEVDNLYYHHGYAPLPNGGYLAAAHDTRQIEGIDGVDVVGDTVWELDSEFQQVRPLWDSWEALTWPEPEPDSGLYDWTHVNIITYVPETEKVLISLYSLSSVIQLDYATGAVEWTFGGPEADIQASPDEAFNSQHGASMFGDELLIFDNGPIPESGLGDAESSVSTYAIDGATADRTRRWTEEDHIYVPTMGNAEAASDGIVTVGWGISGRLTEVEAVSADTFEKRYELGSPLASPFGFVHRIETVEGATW